MFLPTILRVCAFAFLFWLRVTPLQSFPQQEPPSVPNPNVITNEVPPVEPRRKALEDVIRNDDEQGLQQVYKDGKYTVADLDRYELLFRSLSARAYSCMKWMLEKGANPNYRLYTGTPLHESVHYDDTCFTRLLLKFGADVNLRCEYDSTTPLDQAAVQSYYTERYRHFSTANLEVLLQQHKFTRKTLEHALMYAIEHNIYDITQMDLVTDSSRAFPLLVKAGARLNTLIPYYHDVRTTPLILTVITGGGADYLKVLVSLGADPNVRDKQRHTALWYSQHYIQKYGNQAEMIAYLKSVTKPRSSMRKVKR